MVLFNQNNGIVPFNDCNLFVMAFLPTLRLWLCVIWKCNGLVIKIISFIVIILSLSVETPTEPLSLLWKSHISVLTWFTTRPDLMYLLVMFSTQCSMSYKQVFKLLPTLGMNIYCQRILPDIPSRIMGQQKLHKELVLR